MNICGKFGCRTVGVLPCHCKTNYFCSQQCAKEMWKFHKASCQFTLEKIPLQPRFVLPEQFRFVQLYNVIDALDRVNRIVPLVDPEATQQELFEPRLQKFINTATRIDEVCKCKRSINFNVQPSETLAVRGEDSFKQLVANGFPPQLVARSMMFGKSLSFCVTICSVIEVLSRHAGYVCLHGCEKIQTFFLAKGTVRTLRPRINFAEWKDETTVDTQAIESYCILFVPESRFHFEEHAIPGLERAAKIDKEAEEIKKEREKLFKKWHEERQKNSVDPPAEWSSKTAQIFVQVGANCIFVAPAAGEHDETLYANSYSIGVPNWFQIKEIYSTKDLESSFFQGDIQSFVSAKSRQILVDLLGKQRAMKAIEAAINSAADAVPESERSSSSSSSSSTTTTTTTEVPINTDSKQTENAVATVEDCDD